MKNLLKFSALAALLALVAFGCSQDESQPTSPASGILPAALDGDETLGDPIGLMLAAGSGVATGGVGMFPSVDGVLNVTVPMGATVNQVILYWEGQHLMPAGGDASIKVEGFDVIGDLIGGPNFFYTAGADYYSSTYRADITSLNVVVPGANALDITHMDFGTGKDSGAGIVVIYSEVGKPESTIMLRDGNDLAYKFFVEPMKSCVPQEFTFAAAMVDRQAAAIFHVGSVQLAPPDRPDYLRWWLDGVEQTAVCNAFQSDAPGEWAVKIIPLTIPAGATSLKFEPVSDYCNGNMNNPQSFAWIAAAVAIEGIPAEGCTPGYWKNVRMHGCNWTGYPTGADFDATFGVNIFTPNRTLLEALNAGGGGWDALGRHAVAALLNAASAGVDYAYTVAEVRAIVQAAFAAGDPEMYKNQLAMANERYCPLGNCK